MIRHVCFIFGSYLIVERNTLRTWSRSLCLVNMVTQFVPSSIFTLVKVNPESDLEGSKHIRDLLGFLTELPAWNVY